MNDERWLPVVGYEGIYEVSDHGRMMRVHRLVAQAFLGEPPTPEHTDCCHIDGDGTNCPEGHALVEGNLVQHPWRTKGHRVCLKCRRARDARRRAGAG